MTERYGLLEDIPVERVLEHAEESPLLKVRGDVVTLELEAGTMELKENDFLVQLRFDSYSENKYVVTTFVVDAVSETNSNLKAHITKMYRDLPYDETKDTLEQIFADFRE